MIIMYFEIVGNETSKIKPTTLFHLNSVTQSISVCKLKGTFQLNKHLIDRGNDVRDVYVCHNKIKET